MVFAPAGRPEPVTPTTMTDAPGKVKKSRTVSEAQDAEVAAEKKLGTGMGREHEVAEAGSPTKKFGGIKISISPLARGLVVEKATVTEAFVTPGSGRSIVSEVAVVIPGLVGEMYTE